MPSATASTRAAEPSIPDFTAAGGRSSASASSWRVTSATGTGSQLLTPTVFWAVTAVTTLVPNTPNWWNVFRSAWIPAPPPESDPAAGVACTGPLVAPYLARTARGTALVTELEGHAVTVEEVGARVLAQLADTETPQGIIAVIEPRRWTASDFVPAPGAVALVIDGVQDPGNVGTLIRTAHALGAAGTVVLRGTADPTSPKALRAAMGATFRHPVVSLD